MEQIIVILDKDLIEADRKKWRDAIRVDRTNATLDKSVAISVSEVASKVRQMVAEEKTTSLPIESLLVYPFPQPLDGDENTQMSGIACELTVGEEVYLASEETPRRLGSGSNEPEYFSVRPGDFAVLITFEYIYLPRDLMGFLSLRNSYKQRGLIN